MPPRIIVADPDQGFGLMLTQMLEMDNAYVAGFVSNGGRALHLACERKPQLVIIDAALADMAPRVLSSITSKVSDTTYTVLRLPTAL